MFQWKMYTQIYSYISRIGLETLLVYIQCFLRIDVKKWLLILQKDEILWEGPLTSLTFHYSYKKYTESPWDLISVLAKMISSIRCISNCPESKHNPNNLLKTQNKWKCIFKAEKIKIAYWFRNFILYVLYVNKSWAHLSLKYHCKSNYRISGCC